MTHISFLVAPGRSLQLLRKIFIHKNQVIRDIRDKKNEEIASIPIFIEKIDNLKKELEFKEREIELLIADRNILKDLYDQGVIDGKAIFFSKSSLIIFFLHFQ